MYTIENNLLRILVDQKGAELTSIYHKSLQLEYMWEGDPVYWSKHSPVLFPVVGGLKTNTYFFDNRPYQLPRHGFAREKKFSVANQSAASISFTLSDDEETLVVYPFRFELTIKYTIDGSELAVSYQVKNKSNEDMFFSIGGHPAFKVPLVDGTNYDDYYLEFNQEEKSCKWPVSPDGLIESEPSPFFQNDSRIPLKKSLFQQDALVFKDLHSDSVSLRCNKHEHGLDFEFKGFPYMGIWAAKNADFVCIEPWCGIADSVHADQQLKSKEGIIRIVKEKLFEREWKARFW